MGLVVRIDINYPLAPHTLVHIIVREFDHTALPLIITEGDDKWLNMRAREVLLGCFQEQDIIVFRLRFVLPSNVTVPGVIR